MQPDKFLNPYLTSYQPKWPIYCLSKHMHLPCWCSFSWSYGAMIKILGPKIGPLTVWQQPHNPLPPRKRKGEHYSMICALIWCNDQKNKWETLLWMLPYYELLSDPSYVVVYFSFSFSFFFFLFFCLKCSFSSYFEQKKYLI